MTLLELTVVILVLLTLISVLFIGARAWKDGADRSNCILNIRNFQVAVRSYANMKQVEDGTDILIGEIVGANKFMDELPTCPGGGLYTPNLTGYQSVSLPAGSDPATATFLTCDYAASGEPHYPNDVTGW